MKDGRTHLAYKAEHVIDLETELVLAAPIYHADTGDAETLVDSVMEAQMNLAEAGLDVEIEEAVADKGYHCHRHLGVGRLAEHPHLHPGAEAERRTQLAGRAGRETPGGRQQSQPHAAEKEQAAATEAERAGRAEFRPCMRQRRCAAELAAWDREGAKALPDCRDGPQSGPHHAQGVRHGDSEGLAGRGQACFVLCILPGFTRVSFSVVCAGFRCHRPPIHTITQLPLEKRNLSSFCPFFNGLLGMELCCAAHPRYR